ncbi:MAG: serine/threonine-protein kinase [Gemmatimonadota bacterium]|jgi:serine/threonine-protein kinase
MEDKERLMKALADRYQIGREIGSGGMATVYLAHDLRHNRDVAIKVLQSELSAALGPDRFLREIRIAANLNHPHILPVYDSGEANGLLYYVMPFEEGRSLRDRLAKKGELPVPETVRLLRDVVDALAHAHAKGVVHRDIKPDNVLLSGRHALVTDFGVAKAVSQATGRDLVTTVGVALGTPTYMAPEQAVADENVDHRADIYAVGILAYELLAGRPPFLGTAPQMILSAHVTDTPEPVTKYRESTPPELARIVSRCLEKKPADRFQSADELLTQLETLATPSGGVTPAGTRPVQALPRKRIGPGIWASLAVAAALVLSLGFWSISQRSSGSETTLDSRRVVVAEFANETGDSSLDLIGRQAGHWITQGLLQAGMFDVVPWETALQSSRYVQGAVAEGSTRDPVRALAEEVRAGIVISGAYYRDRDSIRMQISLSDLTNDGISGSLDPIAGVEGAYGDLVSLAQQKVLGFVALSSDERLPALSGTMGNQPTFEAYRLFDEGIELRTRREHREALTKFHQAVETDSTFAAAYLYALYSHGALGEWEEMDSLLTAIARRREQVGDYHRYWFDYYRAELDGRNEDALVAIRRASELAPQSFASFRHASMASHLNRPREALAALARLDPEQGAMRGYQSYWISLAMDLIGVSDYEGGLEATRRWREIYPEQTYAVWVESVFLALLGRFEELEAVLDEGESLAMADLDILPTIHGMKLEVIEVLQVQGYESEAHDLLGRTLDWFESRPLEETATESHQRYYGRALFIAGRYDEAQAIYDKLVERHPDYEKLHREWAGNDRAMRALTSLARGDTVQATQDEQWFEALDQPYLRGFDKFSRAVIESGSGNLDRAIALLRQAFDEGFPHAYYFRTMIELAPLRDYPPFQELMSPKG